MRCCFHPLRWPALGLRLPAGYLFQGITRDDIGAQEQPGFHDGRNDDDDDDDDDGVYFYYPLAAPFVLRS